MKNASAESLRDQSKWCQATLSSIADGVITVTADDTIVFLNAAAESMTGWTSAEAAGKPFADVVTLIEEDTREPVERPTVKTPRKGDVTPPTIHSVLVARDGTERNIDDSAALIRGTDGVDHGIVMVFRDYSERRGNEKRIENRLAYAQKIIATLPEPFVVLNSTLEVQIANRAFYKCFQVTASETEGRSLFALGTGQWDTPELRSLLDGVSHDAVSVQNVEVDQEFPVIGRRTMVLNTTRFDAVRGEPLLILLAINDVTDTRAARAVLRASEGRYRRLFETAKDGILILDIATKKIIDANPFMGELLGFAREEFLGRELWELGFPADKAASLAKYRELEATGYIRYDHLDLATNVGESVEVECVCNVYDDNGHHVAQCNIRDIRERMGLERRLHEQALALAEQDQRKDEFLAMLSHELRNPLAPILNAVLVLGMQPNDNPTQLKACGIIERQVGQLKHIVDDLLEVARITTGKVPLRLKSVDINEVVQHALETARPLIDQQGHDLIVELSPVPLVLDADAARLEQVVVNLLGNAAKYTHTGGKINLNVRRDGDNCLISVRDNGVGISADALPHIFELFTQTERSLDRGQRGLGIGLALVHRLVELHQGTVRAFSEVGKGSEFVVSLPLEHATAAKPTTRALAAPLLTKSLRVLIVEDNVDTAKSLAMLLEASGHDVQTAHNGTEALESALEFRPNAVLLDIGLPGLDGYKVATWMRSRLGSDVLLVAVTGYGQDTDLRRSTEAGFDHHLVKPADFREIQRLLATVVR